MLSFVRRNSIIRRAGLCPLALLLALGCGSSSTSSSGGGAPIQAQSDDLKSLQGKWTLVELVRDGRDQGKVNDTILQFEDDIMSDVVPKGGSERFRITLDATKSPKEVNFAELSTDGTVKRFPIGSGPKDNKDVDAIFKGIYELNGDTLRISVAMRSPMDPRPKSIDGGLKDVHRMTFERVK